MRIPTTDQPLHTPSTAALNDAIAAIDVRGYERSRNHLHGQVTRLSPYITHGLTSIPDLMTQLMRTHRLTLADKLAFEFGWREFFHHVWHRCGDAILADMRPGLPGVRYRDTLPDDLREGRTGLAVIDRAVHTLYQTGYLHNHARLWLASYTVHLRKVHWRVAADWLYGHLLDGDLASNHLSWQWVAATFSSKPYLFNADNVARYAPSGWQCSGSAIDCSYEALEQIARSNDTLAGMPALVGMAEPPLLAAPLLAAPIPATPAPALAAGTRVTLVHPWMLTDAAEPANGGLRLGVIHLPFHQRFPWSAQRWDFVMTRLREVTDALFIGDLQALPPALALAGEVISVDTLNPGYREALAQLCAPLLPAPRHFPDPELPCRSFSAFWNKCTAAAATAARTGARSWHR